MPKRRIFRERYGVPEPRAVSFFETQVLLFVSGFPGKQPVAVVQAGLRWGLRAGSNLFDAYCEFGYISGGVPKTAEEKRAVLQRYGMNSEKEARENIDTFMENIKEVNEGMYDYIKRNASGGYADFIFQLDFCNHFYTELPKLTVIKKYPHTSTGQAEFYRDVFPMVAKLPFLLGAFIYCWKDAPRCGYCKQSDCPTETRWGLVDLNDKEKPSYYAVRDALAKIE